jgi:hypothetical protein
LSTQGFVRNADFTLGCEYIVPSGTCLHLVPSGTADIGAARLLSSLAGLSSFFISSNPRLTSWAKALSSLAGLRTMLARECAAVSGQEERRFNQTTRRVICRSYGAWGCLALLSSGLRRRLFYLAPNGAGIFAPLGAAYNSQGRKPLEKIGLSHRAP